MHATWLQRFAEDILNFSNGIWDCPGAHDKRFKCEKVYIRLHPDTKSIIPSGTLKEKIKAKCVVLLTQTATCP